MCVILLSRLIVFNIPLIILHTPFVTLNVNMCVPRVEKERSIKDESVYFC